jgi:chain length determinant protein EpsF
MNPIQLLLILKAHYKVALIVAVVAILGTLVVSLMLPKKYTAITTVLVDIKSPDPVAALIMPPTLSTQLDIINSQRVALKVVRTLGLAESAAVREQWTEATGGKGTIEAWLSELLLRGLAVTPTRESNIVGISYTGAEAGFAAAVANGFAQAYIDVTIELKVEPARQYARWFGEQGKALRDNLEKAQAKLSAFQQEKGIVARDEQLDAETTKLNNLTAELTKVQAEINFARSKQQAGSATSDLLPEVTSNPAVASLRSDVNKLEAKLQETGLNLGRNHPVYLRMQSELAALREKLDQEVQRVTSGFSASRSVGSGNEAALRAAVEAQKKKLLDFRNVRDELAVLQRDVDAAKNAYDTVARRFTETDLASQATQANVTVLTPALPPLEPSSPKPLAKIMVMAAVLGIAFGIGAAFALEYINRRVRSVGDLAEALSLPVLGVIARPRPQGRLQGLLRRPAAMIARW